MCVQKEPQSLRPGLFLTGHRKLLNWNCAHKVAIFRLESFHTKAIAGLVPAYSHDEQGGVLSPAHTGIFNALIHAAGELHSN